MGWVSATSEEDAAARTLLIEIILIPNFQKISDTFQEFTLLIIIIAASCIIHQHPYVVDQRPLKEVNLIIIITAFPIHMLLIK